MSIGFADLRKGMAIEVDGQPYEVMEYEKHKMQQRAPVTRLKLRNLRTSRVTERTFQSYSTEFSLAQVESRPAQYLYSDGQFYYFMDMENYEQSQLIKAQLGDVVNYLKEETIVDVMSYNGEVINVRLPTFVDLEVIEAPPGYKGDTAQGGTKPAVLETGVTIQVPLFVNTGEKVRVDTRSGIYIERTG